MLSYVTSALVATTAFAATGKDWGYKQIGADWGTILDGKYSLCDTGLEQSPIDLTTDTDTSDVMNLIGYNYYDFKASFDPADPTYTTVFADEAKRAESELQITFADGSKSFFTPKQFHFHAPSEHSVDGELYDAEVHFVHVIKGSGTVEDDGSVSGERYGAVIGVFFDTEEGSATENPFITSVQQAAEAGDSDAQEVAVRNFLGSIDMTDYWSYDGSFTTPPCTEGIKWSVIKQVQSISEDQLNWFKSRLADDADFAEGQGNNRIVQNLNQRTLYYSGATSIVTYAAAAMAAVATLFF